MHKFQVALQSNGQRQSRFGSVVSGRSEIGGANNEWFHAESRLLMKILKPAAIPTNQKAPQQQPIDQA
jgi:hypothetical protein